MMATKTIELSPEVRDVLARGSWEISVFHLPARQLDRKLYEAVDKALQALGGKWSRRHGGHLFTSTDAHRRLADALKSGSVLDRMRTMEQFWTPHDVVQRMMELAGDIEGTDVLEPSAGMGAIFFEIIGRGGLPCGVEIDQALASQLTSEVEGRWPIECADFMHWTPRAPYTPAAFDFVLMNPPFSRCQDQLHVRRAFEFLKPGGRLVSVMSNHWTFARDLTSRDFQAWQECAGAIWEPLPEGSFRQSGTGVMTGLLVVDRERDHG
jgi:predicted RNA methylase